MSDLAMSGGLIPRPYVMWVLAIGYLKSKVVVSKPYDTVELSSEQETGSYYSSTKHMKSMLAEKVGSVVYTRMDFS